MAACDRIRFGGVVSGSTLSGGTVVESQAIGLTSWSGLLGHPGFRGGNVNLLGSDGAYHRAKPYNARLMTLSVAAWNRNSNGTVTAPDGKCEELDNNQDTLLGLIDGNGGQFIVEHDLAGGSTRWIRAEVDAPASFVDGPLFGSRHAARTLLVPLVCAYPFWQSETLHSGIPLTTSFTNGGNGRVSNGVYTLSGGAALRNDTNGDRIENLSGSTIVVDVGARTVTQGGSPADNLMHPSTDHWMRFGAGTTPVTVSGTVTATYRDHWL